MGQYTVSREGVLRQILAVDKELVENISKFKLTMECCGRGTGKNDGNLATVLTPPPKQDFAVCPYLIWTAASHVT
jgi:hypothetical protein